MYIYDNIIWEKIGGKEQLWIDTPCDFLGKDDAPFVADVAKSNNVADKEMLRSKLELITKVRNDPSIQDFSPIYLADKKSKLRGYGGGLALVGQFNDGMFFYLPHRGLDAPGDRLIWDICAGRTEFKGESPNWLHRILSEAIEEITFVHNGALVVPYLSFLNEENRKNLVHDNVIIRPMLSDLDLEWVPEKKELFSYEKSQEEKLLFLNNHRLSNHEIRDLLLYQQEILGLEPEIFLEVPLTYIPPRNSIRIYQRTDDKNWLEFDAGWGIEVKYSGLELMAYGLLNFGENLGNLEVYDSEEYAPGKVCGREIHQIDPSSGNVVVYQHGNVKYHFSDIATECDRRDYQRLQHDSSLDQSWQVPIPPYTSSVKADLLTRQESWPFKSDISALKDIEFRG